MVASQKRSAMLTAVLVVAAACSVTGTSSSAPSASLVSAATARPTPVLAAAPTATAKPSPSPIAVLPGEPWILYKWNQEGRSTRGLFLARPNGSDAHEIVTDVPGEHTAASWSPDGSRIAFVVRDSETPDGSIWTASADGSEAKRLFTGGKDCVAVFHPSWSSDGSKLALVCYRDGSRSSIATLDMASMTLRIIATVDQPEFLDNPPRWSPDGASIAFPILHWDPTGDHLDGSLVAVVPAEGGRVDRLTTFDTNMSSPDWRPDGRELVMNSYDLGNIQDTDQPSNLYAIKPDGTGLRQLTHRSVDGTMRITGPRWAPDGTRIYVSIANSVPPSTTVDCVQPAFMDGGRGEPVLLWSSGKCAAGAELRPTP